MSRNTKPWTAEERAAHALQAEAESHLQPLPEVASSPQRRAIRSAHRGQMLDLKDLANRIASMPQGLRRTLPLDDEAQAQLDLLAASNGSERRRVLMRAKLLLGAVDLVVLEAALQGDTPAAARDRDCVRWRTRLVEGDDAVLQAFMAQHPGADRQAIRASVREARGVGPVAERARGRLLGLLREAPVRGEE